MDNLKVHLRASIAATILSGIYAGSLAHVWRDESGWPETTAKKRTYMRDWALGEADALIRDCELSSREIPGSDDVDDLIDEEE